MSKESVAFTELIRRAYHKTNTATTGTTTAPALLFCPKCQRRTQHTDSHINGVIYTTCGACGNETTMRAG